MIDFFYSIDAAIFFFINQTISNPAFDKFFVFITEVKNWYIAYLILLGILVINGGKYGRIAALGAIVTIALSDQISSSLLKEWIGRIRPCNVLDARIFTDSVGCPSSYSFPSSHAVNNFAIAVFFYRFYPKLKWVLFITASLVALSRPYVGVHYPSDIFFGALIGSVIGYATSLAALKTNEYLNSKSQNKSTV